MGVNGECRKAQSYWEEDGLIVGNCALEIGAIA